MVRRLLALLIALPWIALACVRIFSLDFFWPLTPLVAFTPQLALSMIVPIGLALLLRARWTALLLVVAMVWLALLIAPRTIGDDQPSAAGRSLTVLTANLYGEEADANSLARAIRQSRPDVIALQEAGPITIAALRRRGLLDDRPYIAGDPEPGTLGYVTISRWRLSEIPGSGLTLGRWPELRIAGTRIRFRNVHPTPPVTPNASSAWETNLDVIPAPRGQLRIVAGDFNATLDHRAFRNVLARGYRDSADQTGEGLEWTWHTGLIRRLAIDHVLIPPGVAASNYRVFELPGSDHNAVAVTLRLP